MTTVLVTRPPSDSCELLISALQNKGYKTIRLPLIKIEYIEGVVAPEISKYDYLVCISINAAERLTQLLSNKDGKSIKERPLEKVLIDAPRCFTPGNATAKYLASHGARGGTFSPRNDIGAKAMLDMPEWGDVHGKKILVVCGEGGGELPEQELSRRGANVDKLLLYTTKPISYCKNNWLVAGKIDYIWATSGSIINSMRNNIERNNTTELLLSKIIVAGSRLYELAQELGFSNVVALPNASNSTLLNYLREQGDD